MSQSQFRSITIASITLVLIILFQNFRFREMLLGLLDPNMSRRGTLAVGLPNGRTLPPMASTPDGRIIVNRIQSRSKITLTFQPLLQFERDQIWTDTESIDSLMSPNPATKIDIPLTEVLYNPLDEDLFNRNFNGQTLPKPYIYWPDGFGLRQGTVFFDTRFGETAFSLQNPEDCLADTIDPELHRMRPGDFLCYKLIVLMPIRLAPFDPGTNMLAEGEDLTSFTIHRAFQARFSVVVRVKNKGVLLRTPEISESGVVRHSPFAQSLMYKAGYEKPFGMMGLEVSAVSDGRLIIWNDNKDNKGVEGYQSEQNTLALLSFNPKPSNPRNWSAAVYFNELAKRFGPERQDASGTPIGSLRICPTVLSCSDVFRVPFESVFRIASQSFRSGDGNPLAFAYRCAYGWLTPDGGHALCGLSSLDTAIVGPGTNFTLRKVDAPINSFNLIAKLAPMSESSVLGREFCTSLNLGSQDCYRPLDFQPNFVFPNNALRNRPQMPVGLGTDTGFWRSMPGTRPRNLLISQRHPSIQMFLRNDMFNIFRPPTVNANGTYDGAVKLVESPSEWSTFEYADITTAFVDDGEFLFYYQMDPATSSNGGLYPEALGDASGNFLIGVTSESAISEPNFFANHPQKKYFSAEGFQGRGRVMRDPSAMISVTASKKVPASQSLLKERRTQFAFEMALRPISDLSAARLRLANWENAFELTLAEGSLEIKIKSDASANFLTYRSQPLGTRIELNRMTHLGVSFNGAESELGVIEIYVDGSRLAFWKTTIQAIQSTGNFVIGGACIGCSGPIMIIDDVGLSRSARNRKYFRIAAHRSNIDVSTSDSLYPQKTSLPPGFRIIDVQMSESLAPFLATAEQREVQYRQIVDLGNQLFHENRLSTYETAQTNGAARNRGVSCATCHQGPANAFTDGRTIASALPNQPALGFNSPTLVNRVFAKEQFFDQRSQDLFDQVGHPVTNPSEMGGNWTAVLAALNNSPSIKSKFTTAFRTSSVPTKDQVQIALAAFIGTIRSGVNIDAMMDDPRFASGFQVFQGRGRCVACHSGPNFTDELRHDTMGTGLKFKTPTLHNIRRTAPYMHDGSIPNLLAVVEFYNRPPIQNKTLDREIKPLGLRSAEVADLVYFLKRLNGPIQVGND